MMNVFWQYILVCFVSDTRVVQYVPREGASSIVVAVAVVGGVVILLCACSGLFYVLWKLRSLCK